MKKVNWEDFVGKKFNSLTILKITHISDKHGDIKPYAVCKCDCGKETTKYVYNVVKGMAKTCGCGRKASPDTDVGSVYGRLTVIKKADTINGVKRWTCKCICGNEGTYTERSLRLGKRTTCGHCVPIAKPGERYGHLTVLEDLGTVTKASARIRGIKCKCDCGNETIVPNGILIAGRTISCGCMTALNPKDPRSDDPEISRFYKRAFAIINRCTNPESDIFYYYGGRGIKNELGDTPWDVAESLSKIPGYFEGAQIDRINNDGNYSLNNIRWVTSQENTNNSTTVIHMTKEELASRLMVPSTVLKHINRLGTRDDFNIFRFMDLHPDQPNLYLCVHKTLPSEEYIRKIRSNYEDNGFVINYDKIKKMKEKEEFVK